MRIECNKKIVYNVNSTTQWHNSITTVLQFSNKTVHDLVSKTGLAYYFLKLRNFRFFVVKMSNFFQTQFLFLLLPSCGFSLKARGLDMILIFFYVKASGGLCSLILHHNSQSLIIFVHWTQLLEYWSNDTNYTLWIILVFWEFCPCRDFSVH